MTRLYGKHHQKKWRKETNPTKRVDRYPAKTISRECINKAVEKFLKSGGVITKITEDDVRQRTLETMGGIAGIESYEFLNGE